MKVYLDEDELYPYYTLEIATEGGLKPWGVEIDIPNDMWVRYMKVHREFVEMQSALRAIGKGMK